AIAAFALVLTLSLVLRTFIARLIRLKRFTEAPESQWLAQRAFIAAIGRTSTVLLLLLSAYLGSLWLDLPAEKDDLLAKLAVLVLLVQLGLYASAATQVFIDPSVQRKTKADPAAVTSSGVLSFALQFLIWL